MLRPHTNQKAPGPLRGALGTSRDTRGFTLVEVAISVVTTAVIFGASMGLIGTVVTSSATNSRVLRQLDRSVDTIRELRSDLGRAKVLDITDDGSAIRYSIPLMTAEGAPQLDGMGEIVWAGRDRDGLRQGGLNKMGFVPDRTIYEAKQEEDLNGDGDLDDVFEVGHLIRVSDTGERVAIRKMKLWVVHGDRAADVDGDGTPDPIFQVTPEGQIVCRISRPAGDRGIVTTVVRVTVADSSAVTVAGTTAVR